MAFTLAVQLGTQRGAQVQHSALLMGRGGEMTDDVAFFRAREQKAAKRLKELRSTIPSLVANANLELIAERDKLLGSARHMQAELKAMREACAVKDEKIARMNWRLVQRGSGPAHERSKQRGGDAMADVAVAAMADAQAAEAAARLELPTPGITTSGAERSAKPTAAAKWAAAKPTARPATAWSNAPPRSSIGGGGGGSAALTAAKADLAPAIAARWRELKEFAATEAAATETSLAKLDARARDPDYLKRLHYATCTDKAFSFSSPDAEREVKRAAATGSALVVVRHVLEAMGRGKGVALLRMYQGEIDTLTHRGHKATKAYTALLEKVRQLDHCASSCGGDALEGALSAEGGGAELLVAKKEIRQLREAVRAEKRVAEERGDAASKEKQALHDQTGQLQTEVKKLKEKIAYLKRRGGIEVPRPALRGAAARGPESFDVAVVGPSGRLDEAKGQALALVEARGRLQQWQMRATQAENKLASTETSLQRQTKLLDDARQQLEALHDVTAQRETDHKQTVINLRSELVGARMQSRRAYVRAQERYRTKQSDTQTTSEAQTEPCVNKMCQTVEDWPEHSAKSRQADREPEPEPEPETEPGSELVAGVVNKWVSTHDGAAAGTVETVRVAIGFETADVRGAGTSADVCIELFGAAGCGSSGTLLFKNSGVYFKRGSTSWFTVSVPASLWFGTEDETSASATGGHRVTTGPVRVAVGHDLPCEHSSGRTPYGSGRWLLHVVHVVCEATPDDPPLMFWCGDQWFDSADAGGVVRSYTRTAASKLPKLRARPPPDFRLQHPQGLNRLSPADATASGKDGKAVSFAPNIETQPIGGGDTMTTSAPAPGEYLAVVYCRAVTAGTTPQSSRLGVVLRGAPRTVTGVGSTRTAPLIETALICHPMGVERRHHAESEDEHAAAAAAKRKQHAEPGMFAAWSGRDLAAEAEMEYKSMRSRQEILNEEAADAAEYIVDLIIGQTVSIAHQAENVAAGVLHDALGKALGDCTEGQAMVEQLMGDIVGGAERELQQVAATPAAMQAVAMPSVVVPPTPSEQEALAAGLPCTPIGLGEMHTVQLVDLSDSVSGGGAWIFVQGVEIVDVASGRAWWFVGKAWLPAGGGGLCLREQTTSLGALTNA